MKVLVLTADANTLVYHRGDLIRDLAAHGCEVVTSAAEDYPHVRQYLAEVGARHAPIRMVRSRVNPARDWITWLDMFRLFKKEKPNALFAYTIKSVVYGCVVARLAGVPKIYALLPGLGFTFVKPETLKQAAVQWVSKLLHRFALKRADVIFMQNRDDVQLFTELKMLPPGVPVHVTAGSGVNLKEYPHVPLDGNADIASGRIRFVLVSRLLISKGVEVFAEAARQVKAKHPYAEFHLVGPFDPNPNRVTEEQVQGWVKDGILTHHGMVRDIPAVLKDMHVFCLPTWYREGVPHATLEALSMGRAVITTDSVGARECIASDRSNGFLVPPRDVEAVAKAMTFFIQNPDQIALMGQASRKLAEEVFDVKIVNGIILKAMGLTSAAKPPCETSAATSCSLGAGA